MGKVVKYKNKLTGRTYFENQIVGTWNDGTNMLAHEAFITSQLPLEKVEEEIITDQELEEIFDFAKELMRSALLGHGGITPEQAIIYAKEIYKLKDTI